jgi:ketosteroid isomerase-like protein
VHPNEKLIRDFYAAFARRDDKTMAAAYAADATFQDPVFGDLRGARIGAMWRMLCERAADLRIESSAFTANDSSGAAHWEAWYTFSATGRPVHNVIDATFAFANGRIASHVDAFDLYAWSRQALGLKGVLLGWTPFVQNAIRKQAAAGLAAFIQKQGAAS